MAETDCENNTVKEICETPECGGDADPPSTPVVDSPSREITIKVVFQKQKIDVTIAETKTIAQLKEQIQPLIGVPVNMQKIMFKGMPKDSATLIDSKIVNASKVMVIGSTPEDVLSITPSEEDKKESENPVASNAKEPITKQASHRKVLDKYGKPDDAMAGRQNRKEPLPNTPLTGMYNKMGHKVRLTFKLEMDEIWISTKERTQKVPMSSIRQMVNEAIVDHEDYHIIAFQLGPTEASRYWIYWVPAQYVDAIRTTILY